MCLVLGRGFVELERDKAETLFAELPKGETATADTLQDLRERQVWWLVTFKKDDADVERRFADALLTLQGKATNNDDVANQDELQEDNDA